MLWNHPRRRSGGYNERKEHIKIIKEGFQGFGVVCQAVDPNTKGKRTIRDFDQWSLCVLGDFTQDEKCVYARIVDRIPTSDLIGGQTRHATVEKDDKPNRDILGSDLGRLNSAAGFESDPRVRRAIEMHAMAKVEQYLRMKYRGYSIDDVHKHRPYDFKCRSTTRKVFVEVKGSRGRGEIITLTKGEVTFAQRHFPDMVLCIVHSIRVANKKIPKAVGGRLRVISEWSPKDAKLNPIAFRYDLDV